MPNERKVYPFVAPPELNSGKESHFPVIIAGAGPVGLALAIDLAKQGIESVILDEDNQVSVGSRAICWAKRTLEICDRLGCGQRMLDKGVTWNTGKVFFRDDPEPVYSFNLLKDQGQHFPAFINLQQYYAEEYLIDCLPQHPQTTLRWMSEVVAVEPHDDHVRVTARTPQGEYSLTCDYLIAADGFKSPIRNMLSLETEGQTFQDHFLIADIKMNADFPTERWYWFAPSWNPDHSALLHQQPDDIWRIDFQLGWDIDKERELQPENVDRRIRGMLGPDIEFEYEWVSIYTFRCQRMREFVYDRVIFAGDSAHLVSPFGARGANGGIQDADNLAWKLALVLGGKAPTTLVDSYHTERSVAADENILNSTRSTDFITPKSPVSRVFRDATLELAKNHVFAQSLVNSGRLSVPCILDDTPLNTPDSDDFTAKQRPGAPCLDAPVNVNGQSAWFLEQIGERFAGIYVGNGETLPASVQELANDDVPVRTLVVAPGADIDDPSGQLVEGLDAQPGTYYLLRPDQHVCARWRQADAGNIRNARDNALTK